MDPNVIEVSVANHKCGDNQHEYVRYNLHERIYDRHLLTGYYGYVVAREYYEESSLGIGNGILRGIMELEISGLWLGNILMIVVRGHCRSEVVPRGHLAHS